MYKNREEADALNQAVVLLRRRVSLLQEIDEAHEQVEAGMGIDADLVFKRLSEQAKQLAAKSASK